MFTLFLKGDCFETMKTLIDNLWKVSPFFCWEDFLKFFRQGNPVLVIDPTCAKIHLQLFIVVTFDPKMQCHNRTTHKHTQTSIATYRLNLLRARFTEN